MKKLNWHPFFFRLTIVISLIIGLIVFLNIYSENPSLDKFVPGVVLGGFVAGIVWVAYFCFRWIYHGLNPDDEE